MFNIYPLHLKSGEGLDNAIKRLEILKSMFDNAIHKENPIFIMDSNNSIHYEEKYSPEHKMSLLIENYGYKNIVPDKYNECFKMRHGKGNQPSKFYELMFDTIDKILVRSDAMVISENIHGEEQTNKKNQQQIFGFVKYNLENYDYLLNLRLNQREKFKEWCQSKNSTETDSHLFFDNKIFHDLYPNTNAPSDHPPITATISL